MVKSLAKQILWIVMLKIKKLLGETAAFYCFTVSTVIIAPTYNGKSLDRQILKNF